MYCPPSPYRVNPKVLVQGREAGAFGPKNGPDAQQSSTRGFIVAYSSAMDPETHVKVVLSIKHNAVVVFMYRKPQPRGRGDGRAPRRPQHFSAGAGWNPVSLQMLPSDLATRVVSWCALAMGFAPALFAETDEAVQQYMHRASLVCELAITKQQTFAVAKRRIEVAKRSRQLMKEATRVAVRASQRAADAARCLRSGEDFVEHDDDEDDEEADNEEDEEEPANDQADADIVVRPAKRTCRDAASYVKYSRDVYATVAKLRATIERLLASKSKRRAEITRYLGNAAAGDIATQVMPDAVSLSVADDSNEQEE